MADASYKPAAECLAIVLTDLGTSLKLAGNTQEGIQKYYEALKIDPHYAVNFSDPLHFSFCFMWFAWNHLKDPLILINFCYAACILQLRCCVLRNDAI